MAYRGTNLRLAGTALYTPDSTFWLMHKKIKESASLLQPTDLQIPVAPHTASFAPYR